MFWYSLVLVYRYYFTVCVFVFFLIVTTTVPDIRYSSLFSRILLSCSVLFSYLVVLARKIFRNEENYLKYTVFNTVAVILCLYDDATYHDIHRIIPSYKKCTYVCLFMYCSVQPYASDSKVIKRLRPIPSI